MKFRKFTLLFALLASASWLKAQELEQYKRTSVGLDLGITKSYTDITQYSYLPTLKNKLDIQYGGGLHVKRSFTSVFGLQASAAYYKLQGTLRSFGDEDRTTTSVMRAAKLRSWFGGAHPEGVYYNTSIVSVGLDAHLNFSNIDMHYRPGGHRKFLYYMTAGFHLNFYNPEIKNLSTDAAVADNASTLRGTRVDQDADMAGVGRIGAGVRYHLNEKIDLGWEVTQNVLFSKDNLDGMIVSASSHDIYGLSMLSLNYKLGKGTDLIDWKNPGKEIFEDIEAINKRIDSLGSKLDNSIATADADGDGVFDSVDKEPYSPYGAKVDASGKGIDSDGDGVYDGLDKEPNTPAGKLVNFQGIEIKMGSGDDNKGGAAVEAELAKIRAASADVYFPSIFFDTNSSKVRAYDLDKLVRVAAALQKNPGLKIRLVGHADLRGGTEFNQSLSQKRAEAVKEFLVKNLGVDSGKITIESKGETAPMSPSMDSINRRVDVMGQ